jgi:hypothetical protein
MSLECSICRDIFDEKVKAPRVLVNCGHSICTACITKIQVNRGAFGYIVCPICKTQNRFVSGNWPGTFPVNYQLIESTRIPKVSQPHQSFCTAHKRIKTIICLDGKCKVGTVNCMTCLVENHKNCPPDLLLGFEEVPKRLKFESYFKGREGLMKDIDSSIERGKSVFKTHVDQIFEKFSKEIKDLLLDCSFKSLVKCRENYDVKSVQNLAPDQPPILLATPKNKKICDDLFKDLSFDRLINENLFSFHFEWLSSALYSIKENLFHGKPTQNGITSGPDIPFNLYKILTS